jgi:hypothetical protein
VLLALLLVAGLLTAAFTYLPERLIDRYAGALASPDELARYSALFDRRHHEEPLVKAEVFALEPTFDSDLCLLQHTDAKWHAKRFVAEGCPDSVEVRRLRTVEGGWVLKFPKDHLCRGQRQLVLVPATVASIRAKYIELLAMELNVVCPELSFVRLTACGEDLGVFLKEERIDDGFLERRRLTDAALFTQGIAAGRPDHLFPAFEGDTAAPDLVRAAELDHGARARLDRRAAQAVLFLQMLEDRRDLLTGEGLYVYRWTTGGIMPLYRAARGKAPEPPVMDLLLGTAIHADTAGWERIRSGLLASEATWSGRWAALDKAWLPILRGALSMSAAQAEADGIKRELRHRIRHGDVAGHFGAVVAPRVPPAFIEPAWLTDAADAATQRMDLLDRVVKELDVRVSGDTIVFPRGTYDLERDLVVPRGIAVRMEEGARLFLSPGVSLLVNGPLDVLGSRLHPVFIRAAQKDRPFGTVAVSGDGTFTCTLRGLRISGGSEARISGRYHSGMLSIHHADLVMADCEVSGSFAEDAFNLKQGHATIRDCLFEDGFSDLVDLDFVQGEVTGCTFRNGRADSNGDGLDVSGAQVLVRDCRFTRLLDKGISVGEASQVLVLESRFEGNTLGMAVKDLSVAHVDACLFKENTTVFGVYRKKPIHGGAHLFLYTNELVGNGREREVDAHSRIEQRQAPDARVWSQFGVAPAADPPAQARRR